MTWSLSASGHHDGEYATRKAAELASLRRIIEALDEVGQNVTGFSFSGNEVSASSLDQARALLSTGEMPQDRAPER